MRPSSYKFADFETEWKTFAKAIHDEVPSAVLVGPADLSYTPEFISSLGNQVGMITEHYYDGSGEGSGDMQKMLNVDSYLAHTILPTVDSLSSAIPVSFRMGECNIFSEPVTPGHQFAQALWAIDVEFTNALDHSSGINFHSVPGDEPITLNDGRGTVTSVNPIFYAMKLISMAAEGTLLKTAVSAQQATLSAYAVAGKSGSTYVILNNKDSRNAVEASIEFMQPVSSAASFLLTAPSLTSTSGFTLGGEPIAIDGSWTPSKTDQLLVSHYTATVTVPAGSAVLIEASPVSSALAVPYDRLCVESIGGATDGMSLQQSTCDTTAPAESFTFVPTPNGRFNILPQNSNLCLDWQTPPSQVHQTACTQSATQEWSVQTNPDSTYSVATSDGQYCLDVNAASLSEGTPIFTSSCNGAPNKKFSLSNPPGLPLLSSSTTIQLGYDNFCMDIKRQTYSVGPYVQQHPCTEEVNESFAIASTIDGYYTIESNQSQLCLDGSSSNSPVIQNFCTGGSSQKWRLSGNSGGT